MLTLQCTLNADGPKLSYEPGYTAGAYIYQDTDRGDYVVAFDMSTNFFEPQPILTVTDIARFGGKAVRMDAEMLRRYLKEKLAAQFNDPWSAWGHPDSNS